MYSGMYSTTFGRSQPQLQTKTSHDVVTHNAVLLDVHELVVGRGGQHDDGLDVLRLVVEHHHAQADLLALPTLIRTLHFYEEWQHAYVLEDREKCYGKES